MHRICCSIIVVIIVFAPAAWTEEQQTASLVPPQEIEETIAADPQEVEETVAAAPQEVEETTAAAPQEVEETAVAAPEECVEEPSTQPEKIAVSEPDPCENEDDGWLDDDEEMVTVEPEIEIAPDVHAVPMRGLALIDRRDKMLDQEALAKIDGVYIDLPNVPGTSNKLQACLLPLFVDQSLDQNKIKEIKNAIACYYEQYYDPFVMIEVPSQNISAGVLQLIVVRGKAGEISVKGNKWFKSDQIENYLHTEPGDDINLYSIQKDLHLINKNPFRRVDMIYSPGAEFGTTDLVLAVDDCRPIRIYAGADNSGVESTQRQRIYTGVTFGNFLWMDHLMTFQYTTSDDFKRFQGYTLQYTAPVPSGHLLNFFGGYSTVDPEMPDPAMYHHGQTGQASFRYVMPTKLHPRATKEWSLGFDYKVTNNTVLFSELLENFGSYTNLTQFMVGYKRHQEFKTARFDIDLQAFGSPGKILPNESNADYNKLRAGARNEWLYLRGMVRYLQAFPKGFEVSVWLQGQWASAKLLPSEQFGLGGYATVRGYDERQLSMDNAFLANFELRSPLIPLVTMLRAKAAKDALQFLGFIDYGWGCNNNTIETVPTYDYLLGVGPGLRYTLDPYLSLRLDWGFKLHQQAIFTGGASEIHFNVNLSY